MLRLISLIVIHCSATPSGRAISSGVAGKITAADVIDSWHKARGFQRADAAVQAFNPHLHHIGYHYVIDVTGQVFTGRALDEVGAHAANFNANSVGICMVGGIETAARYTPAQWKALKNLVLMQAHRLRVPLCRPLRTTEKDAPAGFRVTAGVCGHRDLSPDKNADGEIKSNEWLKTCPGFDVNACLANTLEPLPAHVFGEA
jgi:N-acetylmuramoyl-L-alanine amidase